MFHVARINLCSRQGYGGQVCKLVYGAQIILNLTLDLGTSWYLGLPTLYLSSFIPFDQI